MKRKFFAFATVICMLCALTLCASAAGFYGENASGDHQGSLFVSGYSVTSSANVDGIAFLAGENVLSTGSTEYIAAAARTVTVEGDVEKDAFTAGQILSVKGDVGRDLFAAGQSLDFAGDVGGTVYAAGDTIVIRGNVAGDAFLSAETIVIDGNASIGGRLHYPANAKITADATILSNALVEEAEPEMEEEANKGTGFGDKVVDKVLLFSGLSVVALVLLCAYIAYIIHAVLVYSFSAKAFAGINPVKFFKGAFAAMMFAFTSTSSAATLPVSKECAHDHGLRPDLALHRRHPRRLARHGERHRAQGARHDDEPLRRGPLHDARGHRPRHRQVLL